MRRHAIVTMTEDKIATVEVSRSSACSHCESSESCHACLALADNRKMSAKALNTLGAKVGDRVEIETDSKTVLAYSAAIFLLPLILATAGYLAVGALTDNTALPYLGALAGFVGTFLFLCLVADKKAASGCDVRIVRIIKGDSDSSEA